LHLKQLPFTLPFTQLGIFIIGEQVCLSALRLKLALQIAQVIEVAQTAQSETLQTRLQVPFVRLYPAAQTAQVYASKQ
jgi:hypothetical protein